MKVEEMPPPVKANDYGDTIPTSIRPSAGQNRSKSCIARSARRNPDTYSTLTCVSEGFFARRAGVLLKRGFSAHGKKPESREKVSGGSFGPPPTVRGQPGDLRRGLLDMNRGRTVLSKDRTRLQILMERRRAVKNRGPGLLYGRQAPFARMVERELSRAARTDGRPSRRRGIIHAPEPICPKQSDGVDEPLQHALVESQRVVPLRGSRRTGLVAERRVTRANLHLNLGPRVPGRPPIDCSIPSNARFKVLPPFAAQTRAVPLNKNIPIRRKQIAVHFHHASRSSNRFVASMRTSRRLNSSSSLSPTTFSVEFSNIIPGTNPEALRAAWTIKVKPSASSGDLP